VGRYALLGIDLVGLGLMITFVSYAIRPFVPFAALGIAISVVGLTTLSLPEPSKRNDFEIAVLKGSVLGIEPLLEEIYKKRSSEEMVEQIPEGNKVVLFKSWGFQENHPVAIYLPSGGQKAAVYIPLDDNSPPNLDNVRHAPTRLLSPGKRQEGIRIFTAGSYLGLVPDIRKEGASVEDILRQVLVETTKLCSSVKALEMEDNIVVEMIHDQVWTMEDTEVDEMIHDHLWSGPEAHRILLGSVPTSMAASIVAAAKSSPVTIEKEEISPTRTVAHFVLWNGTSAGVGRGGVLWGN
jgi:hypothetical protein